MSVTSVPQVLCEDFQFDDYGNIKLLDDPNRLLVELTIQNHFYLIAIQMAVGTRVKNGFKDH